MKTRTKIATFTLAMLLVGTVVYAATDKKRQAKLGIDESDLITEEDTLSAELLDSTEDDEELLKTAAVKGVDDIGDVVKDIEAEVGR